MFDGVKLPACMAHCQGKGVDNSFERSGQKFFNSRCGGNTALPLNTFHIKVVGRMQYAIVWADAISQYNGKTSSLAFIAQMWIKIRILLQAKTLP